MLRVVMAGREAKKAAKAGEAEICSTVEQRGTAPQPKNDCEAAGCVESGRRDLNPRPPEPHAWVPKTADAIVA
jgi:hypothetical protein